MNTKSYGNIVFYRKTHIEQIIILAIGEQSLNLIPQFGCIRSHKELIAFFNILHLLRPVHVDEHQSINGLVVFWVSCDAFLKILNAHFVDEINAFLVQRCIIVFV